MRQRTGVEFLGRLALQCRGPERLADRLAKSGQVIAGFGLPYLVQDCRHADAIQLDPHDTGVQTGRLHEVGQQQRLIETVAGSCHQRAAHPS